MTKNSEIRMVLVALAGMSFIAACGRSERDESTGLVTGALEAAPICGVQHLPSGDLSYGSCADHGLPPGYECIKENLEDPELVDVGQCLLVAGPYQPVEAPRGMVNEPCEGDDGCASSLYCYRGDAQPTCQPYQERDGACSLTTLCAPGDECILDVCRAAGTRIDNPVPAGPAAPATAEFVKGGCAGFNDALYCGGNYIAGDTTHLYECRGGDRYLVARCANSCLAFKGPENDRCR